MINPIFGLFFTQNLQYRIEDIDYPVILKSIKIDMTLIKSISGSSAERLEEKPVII